MKRVAPCALRAFLMALSVLPNAAAGERPAPASDARATYTLVAAGDLIISRPLSMLANGGAFRQAPALASLLQLVRDSDVTYGNMETSIFDYRTFSGFPYSWDGDWMLTAPPSIAADLRAMKFDIVSRANNHALDWGPEGMRSTIRNLDAGGLASAGTGDTLQAATAPGYFHGARGVVGIVSMVSTFRPTTDALPVSASAPIGRPGVNGLALTTEAALDASSYARLVEIRCSFSPPPCPASDTVDFFGTAIRPVKSGETAFTYVYSPSPGDVARNVTAVRQARSAARYVLATIHAHEALTDEQPPTSWQDPAAFLRPLAHTMIDNGADAFITTGIHHVGGMEFYAGKPIFYGLGNFFWSDIQEPLSSELYQSNANRALLGASFQFPDRATDADLTNVLNANSTFATAGPPSLNRTFQTVLMHVDYDDTTRRAIEVKLYPVDLGYGQKLTQSGVPRQAPDAIAELILNRIIALSNGGAATFTKQRENGYLIAVARPVAAQ